MKPWMLKTATITIIVWRMLWAVLKGVLAAILAYILIKTFVDFQDHGVIPPTIPEQTSGVKHADI